LLLLRLSFINYIKLIEFNIHSKMKVRKIEEIVDEIVILEKPVFFQAVAQVYKNWHDVTDSEVIEILNSWQSRQK